MVMLKGFISLIIDSFIDWECIVNHLEGIRQVSRICKWGTSLVIQCLRICLTMHWAQIRSLAQELGSHLHEAIESGHHNSRVHPRVCAPRQEKSPQWEASVPQEKVCTQQQRAPCATMTTQCSQNKENFNILKRICKWKISWFWKKEKSEFWKP